MKTSGEEIVAPTLDVVGSYINLEVNERAFSYYPRLRIVHEFVNANHMHPISLAQAARLAGYESTYFSRFFHQHTGVRFSHWLIATRLQHALSFM